MIMNCCFPLADTIDRPAKFHEKLIGFLLKNGIPYLWKNNEAAGVNL
jgi:hypothetical protein